MNLKSILFKCEDKKLVIAFWSGIKNMQHPSMMKNKRNGVLNVTYGYEYWLGSRI